MIDITAQLILDNLSQRWSVQFFGQKLSGGLKMPLLYRTNMKTEPGRVYVTTPEYLPEEPDFFDNDLLICAGGHPSWRYTRGRFPMVGVDCGDITEVFNAVQDIFDRYNNWGCELERIIEGDADIIAMVRISLPILGNPLAVLDRELYHLALTTGYEINSQDVSAWTVLRTPRLDPDYLARHEVSYKKYFASREMYSPYPGSYSINLFLSGRNEGVVTIGNKRRAFQESDFAMFRFFAGKVERALARHTVLHASHANSLKAVFRDFLMQKPVSSNRLRRVRGRYQLHENQNCICVVFRITEDASSFPVGYLCATLEKQFTGCIAMSVDDSIVAVICLPEDGGFAGPLRQKLEAFLAEAGLRAGVSYAFGNIRSVRTYYRQACSALELGLEIEPDKRLYLFGEHLLSYMLLNCVGEYSVYRLCPPELLRLREKSTNAGVDYWQTLQVLLDNNMNVAQTARDLYLHRSSMLARLDRIREMLETDLDDPKVQLTYRIIMHLFRLEKGKEK